jgi:O-antigen/teichoic acid export membrane protein
VLESVLKHANSSRRLAPTLRFAASLWNTFRGSHGRRAALALVDQLIVGVSNFVTMLLLGRLAGPDDLGVFALVLTVFYLLLTVQESLITMPYTIFGVQFKGIRRRQYSGASLCQSAAWSVCASSFVAVAAAAILFLGTNTGLARVVAAFALVLPLWLLREFTRRYLFAHMQVANVIAMTIAASMVQFIILCILAFTAHLSAASALCAIGIAYGCSSLTWLWLSRAEFQFIQPRWSYFALKNWVMGRWVLAGQATNVLGANIMPWLIWIWLGPTATGLFAACDATLRFANPIIVSLSNVLAPRAALAFNEGGKMELNRIVWKATGLLTLFLFAFCCVLAVEGEWFLNHSFGSAYAGYSATLLLLGLNQLVAKLALGPGRAVLLLERPNILLLAEGSGLAASLAAAPLLIPTFGSIGAAVALLIGSVVTSAITIGGYFVAMRAGGDEEYVSIGAPVPAVAPVRSTST